MLSNLDEIMQEQGLDWIVARGYPDKSPSVFFLLEGARVGHTTVLKRCGEPSFCVVGAMERDEARRAGLQFAVPNDYGHAELLKEGLDPLTTSVRLLTEILRRHEVTGRVAFAGTGDIGGSVALVNEVLAACPQIELAVERDRTAISRARDTKSADAIERIRSVAARTEEVVRSVLALIRACAVDAAGTGLTQPDGSPLMIGDVKNHLRMELARRDLDDHGHTIFAGGREAGFPHSRGDEALPVPVGKPIIFDIFPQEKGGGYYYDMTRTYWIGEATEATKKAYQAVREAFEATVAASRPGVRGADLDDLACDVLERHGYVTKRTDPKTEVGYMHSLGHGVGLAIHERPSLSQRKGNEDTLAAGQVFTIEPGLYFPDEELGIRIEDTLYIDRDGECHSFATLPIDPEIRL